MVFIQEFYDIFNQSLLTGEFSHDWQTANIVPIHKKGSKESTEEARYSSMDLATTGQCVTALVNGVNHNCG